MFDEKLKIHKGQIIFFNMYDTKYVVATTTCPARK